MLNMDDKDFNLDSLIDEINAKTKNKNARDISELDDISFKKETSAADKKAEEIPDAFISDIVEAQKSTSKPDKTESDDINTDAVEKEKTEDEKNENAFDSKIKFSSPQERLASDNIDNRKMDIDLNKGAKQASDNNIEIEKDYELDVKLLKNEQESAEDKPLSVENKPVKKAQKPKKAAPKKAKKKKKKKSFNSSIFGGLILVTIILTISLAVAIGGISLGMEYTGIGKSESEVTFNIPKNSTTDEIAQILYDNKIIDNKRLFKVAMKIKNPAAIYPGDITLHASMGYPSIIETLATMRENYQTVTITFQEGLTLLDVANMLQENQVCSAEDFLFEFNRAQGFDFENNLDSTADSFYKMEGFFFPDTYEFYVDDSAYNVTKIVRQHFEEKITDSMYKKMREKHMSLSEVMTLASIVQWEANSPEDMPKVASVFINRLDDPDTFPSLQSDATKNYITKVIDVVADNNASIDHYTDCYDTYACQGLPAGPICNPGLDAINAVLNPDKTEYYYFCNNLETGKSFFAKTLEEHEKNLKKAGLS